MNERIDEILWKAGGYTKLNYPNDTFLDGRYALTQLQLDNFAELMVKKFDDILLLQQLDCIGNHDKKSAELIEQIRDKTKTYFGVEE